MKARFRRLGLWSCLLGGCLFQGCPIAPNIDPDLILRAQISFASDLAIFLLDNVVASI